ncbi:hypothetical protein JIN77_13985 [Verrucomicrobiaceae bacterium R5-34]|uniref:Uncharacterized protein n=1 Tax=Oceaniferula flava TaxID=2800421 RepID=A0AAE2SGI6_9BACT|nr:hypothetical protein [Oceaniferula flavus]MBK1831840.1 hypothetical protein [Verrucomicrobiaceae bacterium R5-34]MBK1856165.1 hypothetical protein [Oceaniferula flavus]MBM1137472.1 hypothetical protein [Oceaniferula flavus]
MICIVGNRPVLQIGRHQVTGYDTAWLREAIHRGAIAAEREDFPFIDDLLEGIIHYLEHKCPLRVLTIEELHSRVRRMLERIGCEAIANTLPLLAPPVKLSLTRAAKEAGNGFELAFFNQVHDEIEDLKLHGVEELYFTGTRDCVKLLRGAKRWTAPCEKLHQEIITFLTTHGHSTLPNPREIRLTLA